MVSLMLEEAFAEAARLTTVGFPVGVSLSSRLVPDVSFFLSSYVTQVELNLTSLIKKDAFEGKDFKLCPPESLVSGSLEEAETKAPIVCLTLSGRVVVREINDFLDYSLVLLEPPPLMDENGRSLGAVDSEQARWYGGVRFWVIEGGNYYTRTEFLELEPMIVSGLERVMRLFLK
ncbi:unnamed protein product, partial [Discosporangium mesarthrocarpum]